MQQIRNIIEDFLAEENYERQEVILNRLYLQLAQLIQFDESHEQHQFGTSGLLLPTRDAANCLMGAERTGAYWRALLKAVLYQKSLNISSVKVIYPGCGPFACLVLPLLVGIVEHDLEITLIEVNDKSVSYVNKLIKALDVKSLKVKVIQVDALSFNTFEYYDLMISECMLASLQYEGQVAITRHLSQYLTPQATLVPELIQVDLQWIDFIDELNFVEKNRQPGKGLSQQQLKLFRRHISTLLKLDKNIVQRYKREGDYLTLTNVSLGQRSHSEQLLMYTTRIKLADDIWLEEYQNGLTSPQHTELSSNVKGNAFPVSFRLFPRPRFIANTHII